MGQMRRRFGQRNGGGNAVQIDADPGFAAALQVRGNGAADLFKGGGLGGIGRAGAGDDDAGGGNPGRRQHFDKRRRLAIEARRRQRPGQLPAARGIGGGRAGAHRTAGAGEDDKRVRGGIGGGGKRNLHGKTSARNQAQTV